MFMPKVFKANEINKKIMNESTKILFIEKNFNLLTVHQIATSESLQEISTATANNYLVNCIKIRKGICIFCGSRDVKFSESLNFKHKCANCRKTY